MSHEHKHEENCDCEHHQSVKKRDSKIQKHACPTEMFVENLLKNLEKEKDFED